MRDLTLIVLITLFTVRSVGLANGLEGPSFSVVTVEALNAVFMGMARFVLFIPYAHLLAVTTLALAGEGTSAPWIERLAQITGILAMSNLHLFLDLRGVPVYEREKGHQIMSVTLQTTDNLSSNGV